MDKKALSILTQWIKAQLKEGEYFELPQICVWCRNGGKFAIGYRLNDNYYDFYENVSRDYAIWLREDIDKDLTKILKEICDKTRNKNGKWILNFKGTTPCAFSLEPKPCKEYKQIQKWLAKYSNFTLKDNSIYDVRLFGKRSTYGESGKRYFIDHEATTCSKLLEQLRKLRKSGDKVETSIKVFDDIDTKTSSYYETECYGSRYVRAEVIVSTPKGKRKGCVRIER